MMSPSFGEGEPRGATAGHFHESFCTLLVAENLEKLVGTTLHDFLHTSQAVHTNIFKH